MEVTQGQWAALAARHPALHLLVLLGSRATGHEHPGSDWDLGAWGDRGLDLLSLRADTVQLLGTDAVDLIDLHTASAVLRRDAAVTGRTLVDRDGAFPTFQIEAISFWCDVEPVLREAHADVLRALAR